MMRQDVRLRRLSRLLLLVGMLLPLTAVDLWAGAKRPTTDWRAGLAKIRITPDKPIWMAGYADRRKPSEGAIQDLYIKALAIEDAKGRRFVLVTSDLLGFPRALAESVGRQIETRVGLPRAQLMLTSSHTHTGPVLSQSLNGAYNLDAEQVAAVEKYNHELQEKVVRLVGDALKELAPARLSLGRSEAHFGVNRRVLGSNGYRIGVNPAGPVDPDVPVLAVESPDGRLCAVVFGYACHNTTLTGEFYRFSGDYSGYAQAALEQSHPGALALFVMGCGGDINPEPRSKLELAEQHGAALAQSVERGLQGARTPVRGRLRVAFDQNLKLAMAPPSREELQARLSDTNSARRRHAERMLARLDREGRLMSEYPYTLQVVQFGKDLTWIALAGEVVVDYVLRLKRELGAGRLWVTAYANDLFAYIPSERVLKEGGYEGGGAMIPYDLPGPFSPGVEEKIIRRVRELVRQAGR